MAKLKMGLVGGGEGAFIGPVHRLAAELDGEVELVCGALASDPDRARRSGVERYHLSADRSYGSVAAMLQGEAQRPSADRMDFVVIATPNHTHFEIAAAAIRAGFAVVCDKPLCTSMADAHALKRLVHAQDRPFAITYNYSGYPIVKEARHRIAQGELGRIRRVQVEYLQGWLANRLEGEGNKQASWRTDPARAGVAGCMGDIGSHAQHLAEYVSGEAIVACAADITTFVAGRAVDDDANVLMRFANGARGVLSASQVAVGEENGLRLRVYGELGGLEWAQQSPDSLLLKWPNRPLEVIRRGGPGASSAASDATRLPSGHPEAFLEAFANVYRGFVARLRGESTTLDFPDIDAAVHSMGFIHAVIESSRANGRWVDLASLEQ